MMNLPKQILSWYQIASIDIWPYIVTFVNVLALELHI